MLPMNVFGNVGAPTTPGDGRTVVAAVNVTAAQRADLVAGSYLRVELVNAEFATTPASIRVNPLLTALPGSGTDSVQYFAGVAALPAAGQWNITVGPLNNVALDAEMEITIVPAVGAAPTDTLMPLSGIAVAAASTPLTEQAGVVRDPRQNYSRVGETFTLTIQMNQLHTTPTDQMARLLFTLTGANSGDSWVRFMHPSTGVTNGVSWEMRNNGQFRLGGAGDWMSRADAEAALGAFVSGTPFPTAANMWVPSVRVHEDSQIFVGPPAAGVMVPNPYDLFTFGTPGTDVYNGVPNGQLAVVPPYNNGQSLEAWLALSGYGSALIASHIGGSGNNIRNLTGTLVLEISSIAAAEQNSRVTVQRIGSFADPDDTLGRVNLVTNQLLVFGVQGLGVDINGAAARHFVSGLILPTITITERAPQSLHHWWVSSTSNGSNIDADGRGTTTTHQVRLLGPRDYQWNVGGLEHLGPLTVNDYHNVFGGTVTAVPLVVNGQTVMGIDGPTGRPFVVLTLTVPNRGAHPRQNMRARLDITGLALVPSRDNVPYGNVYVDIALGNWTPAGAHFAGGTWTPQATSGNLLVPLVPTFGSPRTTNQQEATFWFNNGWLSQEQYDDLTAAFLVNPYQVFNFWGAAGIIDANTTRALIELGRGVQNVNTGALRSPNNIHPTYLQINTAINHANGAALTPWQRAGLQWILQGGETVTTAGAWTNRGNAWRNEAKHVGIRGAASLELRTYGDIPSLVSGQSAFPGQNWTRTGDHPWTDNASNNAVENSRTARVQLRELAPGALNLGWMASVAEFNLPEELREGVQFVHAYWRVTTYPNTAAYNIGWQGVTVRHDDVHAPINAPGVASLTSESLRVFVPRLERPAVARTLEIVYFVSIRAGFEADFDGADLDIVVAGSAATNLAIANREVTVAYVVDPIQVELLGQLLPIDVGQIMTPTEVTSIPDIRISELDWGRLPRGTTFNIGIEAVPIPVHGNHAFMSTSGIIVCEDGSGLEVRATQMTTANGQIMSMNFEVIRESQEANGPGTLLLTNNRIMGTFLPGIEYGVSVRANAVSANTGRGMTGRGQFDWIPYFVEIIEFGEFDYEGLPPGVGEPGQGTTPPPPQVLRLQEGVPFLGVDQPLVWETVGNYRVGMVSLRAFAYLIGISSDDIDWDEATQTAVIRGYSSQGVPAGVQVTQGVATARVFEAGAWVNHDIASFAHGEGHVLSGRVSAVNRFDRLYVPFRFAANAFGYSVDLIGYNLVEFR